MNKTLILLIIILLFTLNSIAQSNSHSWFKNRDKSTDFTSPNFIAGFLANQEGDSTINYFDVIKADSAYWTKHDKDQYEVEFRDTSEVLPLLTNQQRIDKEQMVYNLKMYENWNQDVQIWVEKNGRIKGNKERQNIIKKAHKK